MSRMFQINEEDLGELERILPQLGQALMPSLTSRLRVQLRRCQAIVSDVRWNYGPPEEVSSISSEEDDDLTASP
jgi:hypothetical protein